MTDEEKDIRQDKVLFQEANESQLEQHKLLLNSDINYKTEFVLKEGIARASAKGFLEKALETPVISIWSRRSTWQAIAAVLIIVFASAFFLADFRSANQFATAELQELPSSSTELFGNAASISRGGEVNWRRLFDESDYELVVNELSWLSVAAQDSLEIKRSQITQALEIKLDQQREHENADVKPTDWDNVGKQFAYQVDSLTVELQNLESKIAQANQGEEKLATLRFALALSKLKTNSSNESQDFGQYEFGWMLVDTSNLPPSIDRTEVLWYSSLSEYKAGNCEESLLRLSELIEYSDSQYYRRAKKFRRKLLRECDLE